MKNLQFPVYIPEKTFKGKLRLFIGSIFLNFNQKLKSKLEGGAHPDGKFERWALSALITDLEKKQNLDGLSSLHAKLWANPQYSNYYDQIVDRNKRGYDLLKEELNSALETLASEPNTIHRLVEFGCGNGWMLNELSKSERLGLIQKFVGLDINSSQIAKNKDLHKNNAKLQFIEGDILNWLEDDTEVNTVYFTFGGVLEYLNGEQFQRLVKLIGDKKNSALLFFEPIANSKSIEKECDTIVFGTESSFSHPYYQEIEKSKLKLSIFNTKSWIGGDWVFIGAKKK
ncbi:MAG: class I SAM-dependent methyltransferase [Mongoliitalea sp.]